MTAPRLVSFGDSFVFGSELEHGTQSAWPALAAQQLGWEYECRAIPGCGNDAIARQVYEYFSQEPDTVTLAVINWTWMSRWDVFVDPASTWITLGPSCVPDLLPPEFSQQQKEYLLNFRSNVVDTNQIFHKYRNLQTIMGCQLYLKSLGIKSVQTYMEYDLLDDRWNAPDYIMTLQSMVRPNMMTWGGCNFLDWARDNHHDISDNWHPLEQAHKNAALFWKEKYDQALAR